MAQLSDTLLQVAVVIYVAAMIGYLVEYAFGTRGAVARVAARPARDLVTAGAPPTAAVQPASPDSGAAVPAPGRTWVAGAIGVALTVLGLAVHIAVIVTRGLAADRFPLGN